jgi:hypothetical protein
MKTIIFVALLLCAPLTCYAAMSQSECPKDTIWNSSTNLCYPDPNAPSVIKARQEEEKARLEAERLKEEQRQKQDRVIDPNRKDNMPNVIGNPPY